jgi:hypothetical protein
MISGNDGQSNLERLDPVTLQPISSMALGSSLSQLVADSETLVVETTTDANTQEITTVNAVSGQAGRTVTVHLLGFGPAALSGRSLWVASSVIAGRANLVRLDPGGGQIQGWPVELGGAFSAGSVAAVGGLIWAAIDTGSVQVTPTNPPPSSGPDLSRPLPPGGWKPVDHAGLRFYVPPDWQVLDLSNSCPQATGPAVVLGRRAGCDPGSSGMRVVVQTLAGADPSLLTTSPKDHTMNIPGLTATQLFRATAPGQPATPGAPIFRAVRIDNLGLLVTVAADPATATGITETLQPAPA